MRLLEITPAMYAAEVLPLTAKLWAGRRDFSTYVVQSIEIARSPYGRRHYHAWGLYDGTQLVASMKSYDRRLRFGNKILRALGIGAVFTPTAFRGRGYASAMLAMQLDVARAREYDLAFLFSDIRPHFYHELGFKNLPSRTIAIRADTLPHQRLGPELLVDADWTGVRRCYDTNEHERNWSFTRTPLVWDWLQLRIRQGCEHPIGTDTNLVVRRGRRVAAYILGMRAPERDAYLLDEFGYADEAAAEMIPALLRSAAGDLQRILGWLPPDGARQLLSRGTIRTRTDAITMAASLTLRGEDWLDTARQPSAADGVWGTEHI